MKPSVQFPIKGSSQARFGKRYADSGSFRNLSNSSDGSIDSVNITTGATTTLYNGGLRPYGLAYDTNGDVFAVLGLNEVPQIDPVTGVVMKTISTPNRPDGMTFDATTGMLYVSSDGGGFYTPPTNLSSATFMSVSGSPEFDGIANIGNLLYFVVRDTDGVQYNLTTGIITESSSAISGADDIAPVAGLGSSSTPEPSSIFAIRLWATRDRICQKVGLTQVGVALAPSVGIGISRGRQWAAPSVRRCPVPHR